MTNGEVNDLETYDRKLFFKTLEKLGANEEIIADMQTILDGPNSNPDKIFRKLMKDTGLNARFENDALVSIQYPPNRG